MQGIEFFRRVIRIRAEDSPNVRLAQAELAAGKDPSGRVLVPGVLTYPEYCHRRRTWDKVRQQIGLDATFPDGDAVKMYPADWLTAAKRRAAALRLLRVPRVAKAVGVDPAEGGDKTAMAAGDELGVIEIVSRKTPQTTDVTGEAIAFGKRHNVPAAKWYFDRGGGGKQHADRLRLQGYPVQTVGFGETISADVKKGQRLIAGYTERRDLKEEKYTYVDRRSQMAWMLREQLDPALNPAGYGVPAEYDGNYAQGEIDLFNQLDAIPLTVDEEGRFDLLPKHKADKTRKGLFTGNLDDEQGTLVGLIGHSPDEFDAVCLMLYGMLHKTYRAAAGLVAG